LSNPSEGLQRFLIGLEVLGIFGQDIASKTGLHIDDSPHVLGCSLLGQVEMVQSLFILRKGLQVAIGHDAGEDEGSERDRRDEQKFVMDRKITEQTGDRLEHGDSVSLL
jgi:hypothetical protein